MPEWDISEIADALHGGDRESFLDPETGTVHAGIDGEFFDDNGDVLDEVPEDWLYLRTADSREEYAEMEEFAELITSPAMRAELDTALAGRGPFRRFRDVVYGNEVLGHAWNGYRDARRAVEAVEWLIDAELLDGGEQERLHRSTTAALEAAIAAVAGLADTELREVELLERRLQDPIHRRDAQWLASVLADEFEEVGKSGRLFSRGDTLAMLSSEQDTTIEIHDLASRLLAPDLALVTWVSFSDGVHARRTSLWRRDAGSWRLVHHQGTPIIPSETLPGSTP